MQRLIPRAPGMASESAQDPVVAEVGAVQRGVTEARAPMTRSARNVQPLVIPMDRGQVATQAGAAQAVTSTTLLQGCKTVQIMHNGEPYTLRATKHGKLILTK